MSNRTRILRDRVLQVVDRLLARKCPVRFMPAELEQRFTLDGKIPVLQRYMNDTESKNLVWRIDSPYWSPTAVQNRAEKYYGPTDSFFYQALDQYPLRELETLIVGSESPWYECICATHGARVTTIEYRQIDNDIPGLTTLTPSEFAKNPRTFDAAVSISSLEHDGLGRYGDPIDPDGDLRAMRELRSYLKPGGLLYLAMPVGQDAVVWNAHRIYGRLRLPLLFQGWEELARFGFQPDTFDAPLGHVVNQPVFVLRAKA